MKQDFFFLSKTDENALTKEGNDIIIYKQFGGCGEEAQHTWL